MREKPLKKNSRFYLGMVLNVVEGMLSGFNFLLLYEAMKMLWNGTINSPSLLRLSSVPYLYGWSATYRCDAVL